MTWRRAVSLLPTWIASLWTAVSACGGDVTPPVGPEAQRVVTSIEIDPSERTMGILGVTVHLAAAARAEDGSFLYGLGAHPERFSWSSSDPDVAMVDDAGSITSVSEGTATITATVEGVTGNMTVTVRDAASLAWSVKTGSPEMRAGVTIGTDGTIYVAARTTLFAISPQGGILWTLGTPSGVLSTPAIGDDGTLYVGSTSGGGLTAVRPNGTVQWELSDIGSISSSPALGPDGTIYVASSDHHVYAVSPLGEVRWAYEGGDQFFLSSPAVATDGTIYVGNSDRHLHAINPDGSARWMFRAGDQVQSSPSIGLDGTIYFGSYDDRLYAVNPDGTERWTSMPLTKSVSSPSIGPDGTIYVGAEGVFAFDPGGTVRWSWPSGKVITTPILGADGTVYVAVPALGGGVLHALDAQGRLLWDYPTGNTILGSPAIGLDGTILATSDVGTIYAIVENGSTNGGFSGAPWPKDQGNRANTGRAGG